MIEEVEFAAIVTAALAEDLGNAGDITSNAVVEPTHRSTAQVVTRSAGVIAGIPVAAHVFLEVEPMIEAEFIEEGTRVDAGTTVGTVSGPSRGILTAERTALNILGRMSGVATATAALVDAVVGTRARITDTRKTMPGLRALDKYAVTVGGGVNHRMGLYDQVMIKDNHIVAAGDVGRAVAIARDAVGEHIKVIVEVENLDQLEQALLTDADRVLLDNMGTEMLGAAVGMVAGKMETEASGGVTLETVRAIAETGVDFISVGWITHSAPQVDVGLDFLPAH